MHYRAGAAFEMVGQVGHRLYHFWTYHELHEHSNVLLPFFPHILDENYHVYVYSCLGFHSRQRKQLDL